MKKSTTLSIIIIVFVASMLAGWFIYSKLTESKPSFEPDGTMDEGDRELPDDNSTTNESSDDESPYEPPVVYNNTFFISQAELCLDDEYIQYQIRFEGNDIIDITVNMNYSYREYNPLFYIVILTDGEREITRDMYLRTNPLSMFDVNGMRRQWLFGRKAYSDEKAFSDTREVQKGDVWYLTIGVHTDSKGYMVMNYLRDSLTVTLQGRNNVMNVSVFVRNGVLEYYSMQHEQFGTDKQNRYLGVGLFGMGFSRGKAEKTITVENGIVVHCSMERYLIGSISYASPGKNIGSVEAGTGCIKNIYFYESNNLKGDWLFSITGFSPVTKFTASLFYMDVDIKGILNK